MIKKTKGKMNQPYAMKLIMAMARTTPETTKKTTTETPEMTRQAK